MFYSKQLNWIILSCVALLFTISFSACGDDDPEEDNCLPDFGTSVANGSFMGSTFTLAEGTAKEDFADENKYRITFYGESIMGDACDNFNFERPVFSIIFSVPKEVGVYTLGFDAGNTVTFNDASVVNEVNADVAICGAVEIVSVTADLVTGRIDAFANDDSDLNGTFSVRLCP